MEYTSFTPHYNNSVEQSAQYLRQIIPLLVRYKIPADPINYALWYEYVGGDNKRLIHEIDTMLRKRKPFDTHVSIDLYKRHVCHTSVKHFEDIGHAIQGIMDNTQEVVTSSGLKAEQAGERFDENSSKLGAAKNLQNVQSVLSDITKDTKGLALTSKELKNKLDNANAEMEKLRKELAIVREVARTDILTGLLNRRALDHALDEFNDDSRRARKACFILFDLDHFKRINDNFGHLLGDKVLRFTGNLIQEHLPENYIAARYGGEELAIIAPNADLDSAKKLADIIRLTLSKSNLKRKDTNTSIGMVTLSAGIAYLKPDDTIEHWVARADAALYKAKENGRNQVVCDSELQTLSSVIV